MFSITKNYAAAIVFITVIVSLLKNENLCFAADVKILNDSSILVSFKDSISHNIYPVCIDGKYRFINYKGHFVNKFIYDQIFCRYPENQILALGKRDDIWYGVDHTGNETLIEFPNGFDPVEANTSLFFPDNIFCITDVNAVSSKRLERLYDTKRKEFLTEELSSCTYSDTCWIGISISPVLIVLSNLKRQNRGNTL